MENGITDKKNAIYSGDSSEYFRIWIINIFLTIVTLGIYSAWAKVINTKYLYQNINIDGHRLDYIANPVNIFIGRLIATVFLVVFYLVSIFLPIVFYWLMLLVLFFLFPLIINRSLSFQYRMTTYRNVRFNFKGTYIESLWYFLIFPFVISIFTIGGTYPLALKYADEYRIRNTKFGNVPVSPLLSPGPYYGAFGISIAIVFGAAIVFAILISLLLVIFISAGLSETATFVFTYVNSLFFYISIIAVTTSVWAVAIRNHTFNNSVIPNVAKFNSTMKYGAYIKLTIVNVFAVILSIGLATPWAVTRNLKYLSNTLEVHTEKGVDKVIDDIADDNSAIMDEVAGAFDIQI
tara:strand:+ start:4009 stop:5055 length:1047 start_codon:yes stop_codon:yes gene_type:complete